MQPARQQRENGLAAYPDFWSNSRASAACTKDAHLPVDGGVRALCAPLPAMMVIA
jgi:hypothetical protein